MPTAASMSASVSMLSTHSPESANGRERSERPGAARAGRRSASASSVPATVVPIQVSQTSRSLNHVDEVVDEDPEAVEDREEEPATAFEALVEEPGLDRVEPRLQRRSRRGRSATGTRSSSRGTRATSRATIAADLDDLPAPPRDVRDDWERERTSSVIVVTGV